MGVYSTSEVAKVFGMTESNILNLIKSGKLKYESQETSSGRYYFAPTEIRKYYKKYLEKEGIIFSIANIKGGTGKSFFSYVFSLGLIHLGFKVLLIDVDEQANISEHILESIPNPEDTTILEIFNGDVIVSKEEDGIEKLNREKTKKNILDLVRKTNLGIDLIPSNLRFMTELKRNDHDTYTNLSKCLNLIRDEYDFIVLDTPPTISLQNEAAIIAADHIIAVLKPAKWSIIGIQWLLKKTNSLFEDSEKEPHKMLGCIYNMVEEKKEITKRYIEKTKDGIGNIKVFETRIPFREAYNKSIEYREDPYLWVNKKVLAAKKILVKITLEILNELRKNRKRK